MIERKQSCYEWLNSLIRILEISIVTRVLSYIHDLSWSRSNSQSPESMTVEIPDEIENCC